VRSRWGASNVTRSIHGPARPPRPWQASSATEPVASVHHRDCRDRRLRSRRTSPALTCRDWLRAVGPSVTGWRRLQLGELCGICVARSGIAAETGNGKCRFAGTLRDGSEGTRTRDLRRDGRVRHRDAWRRTPPNGLICRAFLLGGQPGAAWLSQSSNRRLGHEWATILPWQTTPRPWANRLTTSQGGAVVCLCGSYRTCMSTGVGRVVG
jgi:hypothetical protein